jgi:hypothetical protein
MWRMPAPLGNCKAGRQQIILAKQQQIQKQQHWQRQQQQQMLGVHLVSWLLWCLLAAAVLGSSGR